jgi:hypothetical protein
VETERDILRAIAKLIAETPPGSIYKYKGRRKFISRSVLFELLRQDEHKARQKRMKHAEYLGTYSDCPNPKCGGDMYGVNVGTPTTEHSVPPEVFLDDVRNNWPQTGLWLLFPDGQEIVIHNCGINPRPKR